MSIPFWDRIDKINKEKSMPTKLARNSTTIQGAIIGSIVLILNILRMFGLNLDLDEGILTELIASMFGLASIIMVVVGRIKARTELSGF